MRVRIVSNFLIPGLEGESITIENRSTLRQLLEHVSELSEGSFTFFEFGRDTLDPDDWDVDVNGIALDGHKIGPETELEADDVVAIRLLMYSGG